MNKLLESEFLNKSLVYLAHVTGYLFACYVYGALPSIGSPDATQVVGTILGWAHAFHNGDGISLYSYNFGYPEPASRSFGVLGVLITELYLHLGMDDLTAVLMMLMSVILIAYIGAIKFANILGVTKLNSILLATLWICLPIVSAHNGYSMLGLGIALIPTYMITTVYFLKKFHSSEELSYTVALPHFVIAISAIFMDGYTFVMFALAALIVVFSNLAIHRVCWKTHVAAILIHSAIVLVAYLLYKIYVGDLPLSGAPIEFFRAWGADLSFFFLPTQGYHFIWDMLGLSVERSNSEFFGDRSTWITTFCFPLLIASTVAWFSLKQKSFAPAFLVVMIFGFYMSLGPSLKFDSKRTTEYDHASMPASSALMPTGSAIISSHIPGFKSMRASYRWAALGMFGAWVILCFAQGGNLSKRQRYAVSIGLIVLIACFVPNPEKHNIRLQKSKNAIQNIQETLLPELGKEIATDDIIAFLPYNNDLLINYLSAKLNFQTFNIGGDKNLMLAKSAWPAQMQQMQINQVDNNFVLRVLLLLASGDADQVVIPKIDTLRFGRGLIEPEYLDDIHLPLNILKENEALKVIEDKNFIFIRLSDSVNSGLTYESAIEYLKPFFCEDFYPLEISESVCAMVFAIGKGWHLPEEQHIWSSKESHLWLWVPQDCLQLSCNAKLSFSVFGASKSRPADLVVTTLNSAEAFTQHVKFDSDEDKVVLVPLKGNIGFQEIKVNVPSAISPKQLVGADDTRVLGIALKRIELVNK